MIMYWKNYLKICHLKFADCWVFLIPNLALWPLKERPKYIIYKAIISFVYIVLVQSDTRVAIV